MSSNKIVPIDGFQQSPKIPNVGPNKDKIESLSLELDETNFDPKLCNKDLKPLHQQNWNVYNIFAVWMSGGVKITNIPHN
jgi:cytosine/uracil/thiamine/allantoin permease